MTGTKTRALDFTEALNAPKVQPPDKEYVTLAKKLGVAIASLPEETMLRSLLTELSISVYDYSAVRSYLISKKPDNHFFVWVPAIAKQGIRALSERRKNFANLQSWDRGVHGSILVGHVYSKPIPYPALVTMDAIKTKAKELGFTPTFFVSDFSKKHEKPRPMRLDPFLAVGTSESDALFVIERWDEPGFREELYTKKVRPAGMKTRRKTARRKIAVPLVRF